MHRRRTIGRIHDPTTDRILGQILIQDVVSARQRNHRSQACQVTTTVVTEGLVVQLIQVCIRTVNRVKEDLVIARRNPTERVSTVRIGGHTRDTRAGHRIQQINRYRRNRCTINRVTNRATQRGTQRQLFIQRGDARTSSDCDQSPQICHVTTTVVTEDFVIQLIQVIIGTRHAVVIAVEVNLVVASTGKRYHIGAIRIVAGSRYRLSCRIHRLDPHRIHWRHTIGCIDYDSVK